MLLATLAAGCTGVERSSLLDCADAGACVASPDTGVVLPPGTRIDGVRTPGSDVGGEGMPGDEGGGPRACASAGVRIAEVLYDPAGPDGRGENEFVELRAEPGSRMEGHTLVFLDDDGVRVTQRVELSGLVGADGLWLVGGALVADADQRTRAPIQNGPDLVRVVGCDGATVDEVGYATDWEVRDSTVWRGRTRDGESLVACQDAGPAAVRWRTGPPSPGTMGPHAAVCGGASAEVDAGGDGGAGGETGADAGGLGDATDAHADAHGDTGAEVVPPPGDVGTEAPGPTCIRAPDGVRLSEALVDEVGVDRGEDEFVELEGPAHRSFDVVLRGYDGNGGREYLTHRERVTTNATGYAVLRPSVLLQNGPDSFVLETCDGVVLDRLAYGNFGADHRGFGFGGAARTPAPGRTMARCPGAVSRNDNRSEFHDGSPTPGARNAGFAEGVCSPAAPPPPPPPPPDDPPSACPCTGPGCAWRSDARVWLSEVFYDNEGTDRRDLEFVELHGSAGAALDGLALVGRDAGSTGSWMQLGLDGLRLDASGRAVVGATRSVAGRRELPTNLQNGPDALFLVACGDAVLDAVGWGRWPSGVTADHPLMSAPAGSSIARCDGADERSPWVPSHPTDGAPNEPVDGAACGVRACAAVPDWLVVNEVALRGAAGEPESQYLELAGPARLVLDDVLVLLIGPSGDAVAWYLWGDTGPEGLALLALPEAPPWIGFWVDDTLLAPLSWPRGAVQIEDCRGDLLDAVAWGTWPSGPSWGWGTPAPTPRDGSSIGRDAMSRDTLDNASDFAHQARRTPGERNP